MVSILEVGVLNEEHAACTGMIVTGQLSNTMQLKIIQKNLFNFLLFITLVLSFLIYRDFTIKIFNRIYRIKKFILIIHIIHFSILDEIAIIFV